MWFRVNPRMMRILRHVREDPIYKKASMIRTTHLKKRYEDMIGQISRCSGLPSEFVPLFFETFSITWDEMWYLAESLLKDDRCGDNNVHVDYFPNDTFLRLDIHRVNQYKGNFIKWTAMDAAP